MPWNPLITSNPLKQKHTLLLQEITTKLDEILDKKETPEREFSLYIGKAGIALYYAYWSQFTQEQKYMAKALALILALSPRMGINFAPPVNDSGAPHSSVLMWASSWQ